MSIGRVSTLAIYNSTLRDMNRSQLDLYEVQGQVSSGLKSQNYQGLNGQVDQFVQLESKLAKSKIYKQNNDVNISRIQTTNVALTQIINIGQDMNNLMTLHRDPALKNDISFNEQMDGYIKSLARELNTSFDGRYLFGGTRTDVNPVAVDPEIPSPVTIGTLDTNYYQGSAENVEVRADENTLITVDARADNIGFQRLFGAAALAIKAHNEPNTTDSDDMMKQAIDMVQQGIKDVTSIQANANANELLLNNINNRHEQLQLYWQGVVESISKTDVLAASTKLSNDQSVLQATFQAFAKVTGLKLSDYLR